MRKRFTRVLLAAVAAALWTPAQGEVLLEEKFDYPAGGLYGQGGWLQYGTKTDAPLSVEDKALSYSGYAAAEGKSAKLAGLSDATDQSLYHVLPGVGGAETITSGDVYLAALINVQEAGNNVYFMSFAPGTASFPADTRAGSEIGRLFISEGDAAGTFKLGILPTVAPYLLPRFFPQLMKKYPDLDIRVVEMKTNDIKKALQTGEIDAGIVASLAGMEELQQTPLFYEQFFAYVSREDALFNNEVIRTSDLNGEQLWLLDEGHCFRDQLVRFCQMKSARASQLAYHLGSMETFMRMVESGKGVTFIPELAVLQLGDAQKELVRSFAIPCPTRQVVLLTNKNFIRHTLLEVLVKEIKLSVPKEMLSLKATQAVV